uniref:Protein kinase domain-containing protein n=1 Tax=Florenciella parvula TaxID=236787 RepID=A0A7S2C537_9STRA
MDVLISRTAAGDYAPLPDDTPSNLKDFVAGLLVVNPRERLGSSTIRQHALFEGTDWDSLATHTKTPGPIRGRTASSADSASLHCTQAELHEWQLPLVNRFFELRTDASLKTDAWGDIMEKMAIYIRPSLHFKYSTAMATCPLTKKHFVVGIDELTDELERNRSTQAYKVHFDTVREQFAACDYSSAMGAFTMRVSGDELPDGVDGFMVRGGLKVCFSPNRKISRMEVIFDVYAFMQLWNSAMGLQNGSKSSARSMVAASPSNEPAAIETRQEGADPDQSEAVPMAVSSSGAKEVVEVEADVKEAAVAASDS